MIISFPHRPQKEGGPGSFQERLETVFLKTGWEILYQDSKKKPDAVLVVGGTRKLGWLIKQRIRGVPVIYRLDGINWIHRKTNVSVKKWLLNETRNLLFQIIRSFIATHIIYQSTFVRDWWNKKGWRTTAGYTVIHNGVDIEKFKPRRSKANPISLLAVEGNLDYSPYAIELLNQLQEQLTDLPFESIVLYGGFQSEESKKKLNKEIDYRGKVARSELPEVYTDAVYLSLDVNAACPNTVVEALASGIPVIGFDTGSLRELVSEQAGEIVPYGSDPWELSFPDIKSLMASAQKVNENWNLYAEGARKSAERNFNMEKVAERYVEVIESQLNKDDDG